jgi:hypothetical protein
MIVAPGGGAAGSWWPPAFSVQALPTLSASDAALLAVHACLGALPLAEACVRSPSAAGEALLLLAAVLFSRLRSARTPLAAAQQLLALLQAAAVVAVARAGGAGGARDAARLLLALLLLWTAAPLARAGGGAAAAAAAARGVRALSPAEVAALKATDAHWAPAAAAAAGDDAAKPCTLVAVHVGAADAFLHTFAAAAAAASAPAAARCAFATLDAARWPALLARVVAVDTGLFSEQLPSVLKFVRGGSARQPEAPAPAAGAPPPPPPPPPASWLRRLPHVHEDGTTVPSALSLHALQVNFALL